ncbi:MAG: hypothetical protein WBE72_23670 [Terracidiphilus sp.]
MANKPMLHAFSAIRIPVMLAIVLGEAAGLIFFAGTRNLYLALAFSVACAAINAASLWLDRVEEEGIEPMWVAISSFALVPGAYDWTARGTIDNIFYAAFAAFIFAVIVLVVIQHSKRTKPAAQEPEAQIEGPRYRGTLFCAVIALTTFERAIEFLRHHNLSVA